MVLKILENTASYSVRRCIRVTTLCIRRPSGQLETGVGLPGSTTPAWQTVFSTDLFSRPYRGIGQTSAIWTTFITSVEASERKLFTEVFLVKLRRPRRSIHWIRVDRPELTRSALLMIDERLSPRLRDELKAADETRTVCCCF